MQRPLPRNLKAIVELEDERLVTGAEEDAHLSLPFPRFRFQVVCPRLITSASVPMRSSTYSVLVLMKFYLILPGFATLVREFENFPPFV